MKRNPTPHQRADALASRQYAAISRRQALGVGLTRHEIAYLVESGRWEIAARGVYTIAGAPKTWLQTAMVAVLAGPAGRTNVSHLSAAALLGVGPPPLIPHVTVPRNANAGFRNALVHRADLDAKDVWVIKALPCVRPARMLVECAEHLPYSELCDLVDDTLFRPLTEAPAVWQAMERASLRPGRKGLPNLERALEVWTPGAPPGSPAEMRLIRRCREWGLPLPERQIQVRGADGKLLAEIDFGWPDPLVGVEYDSERFHGPRRWDRDDDRDDRLRALGWRIEHADKRDFRPGATRLRRRLCDALGIRFAS